jgi:hypothetical protein
MVPYGCGDDDEGIDFEVGELEIDVDAVESDDKVNQDVLRFGRDMGEEILLQGGERRERLGGSDDNLGSLGIDITDVNTTFMIEQDVVSFTFRVDVDVVLRLLGMRNKWLDEEIGQVSLDMLDLEKTLMRVSSEKGCLTCCSLPARSSIHFRLSSQPLLRHKSPLLPRRLINMSGLATSFRPSLTHGFKASARSRTSLTCAG